MEARRMLSALVIRNIGDLEAAMSHATEVIDDRLHEESMAILERSLAKADWHCAFGEGFTDDWFAPKEWMIAEDDADLWFRLTARDTESTSSWLAMFVGEAPEEARMSILLQSNAKKKAIKQILADPEIQTALRESGLRNNGAAVWLPIEINAELLAAGFENDDLDDALAPIAVAAEMVSKARPGLDLLRDRLRGLDE